jgi:hypothetical protein
MASARFRDSHKPVSPPLSGETDKSVVLLYGTIPRKYFPPVTLPVITWLLLVSIGFMLGINPDLYAVGGTVPSPKGFEEPGLSSDNPTAGKQTTAVTAI